MPSPSIARTGAQRPIGRNRRAGLRRRPRSRRTGSRFSASPAASNLVPATTSCAGTLRRRQAEGPGPRTPSNPTGAGDGDFLSDSDRKSPGSIQQADLAQDRDAVGVDVLALDEAVLEGNDVEAVPLDAAAGRLGA